MDEEELKGKEMPFWEHLAELALRLRRIVTVVLILTVVFLLLPSDPSDIFKLLTGDINYKPISIYILLKIRDDLVGNLGIKLMAQSFAAPILLYVEAAIVMAIAISLPYIAYELYLFVEPGLYPHEKKFLKSFVFSFSILFIVGALYGYYIIMPITFKVLLLFPALINIEKLFSVQDFYELVFLGIVANGFFFTLPVFIVLAIKFRLVDVETLSKNKRYVYVIVMIIAAIITPDPTPVSMLLLSVPFILLYELSIFVGKRVKPI